MDGNGVSCYIGRNGVRVEEGYTFYYCYYRVRNASDEKHTSRVSRNQGWIRRKGALHVEAILKTPLR